MGVGIKQLDCKLVLEISTSVTRIQRNKPTEVHTKKQCVMRRMKIHACDCGSLLNGKSYHSWQVIHGPRSLLASCRICYLIIEGENKVCQR